MGKEVAEKYVQGQGGGQWEEGWKLQSRSITGVKGSEGTSWERNLELRGDFPDGQWLRLHAPKEAWIPYLVRELDSTCRNQGSAQPNK